MLGVVLEVMVSVSAGAEKVVEEKREEVIVEQIDIDLNKGIKTPMTLFRWPAWVEKHRVDRVKKLQCFETIRSMVVSGMPSIEVGRQIIALGEGDGATPQTWASYIEHFKATVPKGEIVAKINPALYSKVNQKFVEQVNLVDDFMALRDLAMTRARKFSEREIAMGLPVAQADKAIETALKATNALAEYQERLGLVKPLSGDTPQNEIYGVNFDHLYQTSGINEAIKDPKSRLKVVKFIEQVVGIGEQMSEAQHDTILALKKKIDDEKAAKLKASEIEDVEFEVEVVETQDENIASNNAPPSM